MSDFAALPSRSAWRLAAAVLCAAAGVMHAKTLDLETATIPELQRAYDEGLTAERVVTAYMERIARYDDAGPRLNAILSLNQNALAEARALDAERKNRGPRSAVHGVPILVKDNIDTCDLPTTGGAKAWAGLIPPHDACVIASLRAAGAIVLAKTNLDEFARGATGTSALGGQTLNPYNFSKISGGSSAGSAVGTAALFGWAALGTETGSSIRNPATKNNLVGFCPSEGLVSRRGVIPSSLIVDRVGTLARNVTDAVAIMSVIAGPDPGDFSTLPSAGASQPEMWHRALRRDGLKGARIGVLRQLFGHQCEDRPAVALIDEALATMHAQGATIVELPDAVPDLWTTVRHVTGGDGEDSRVAMEYYFSTRGKNFPFHTLAELAASPGILERTRARFTNDLKSAPLDRNPAYLANNRDRAQLRATITAVMESNHLDALVYPHETKAARTLAEELPSPGTKPQPDNRGAGRGNTISTAAGLPAIVVPVGFNVDHVGVGIEFLGRLFDEATVIRLAYAFEQAAPHRELPASTPRIGVERLEY